MNIPKINSPKSILLIASLAIVLNILRIIIWGKNSFVYIPWNIFLAFIPFCISYVLFYLHQEKKLNTGVFIIGFLLWLLFIPNAPYIITDFIHLGEIRAVPIIFDTLLLFSSATVGLALCFQSLFHIEEIIRTKFSKTNTSLILGFIILLISFGVYLGRFLRFNSWDIFINHTTLIKNVWKIFSQSNSHIEVYLYTLLFFLFLTLFYRAWKFSNTK
jgi:uncharacterized membrane protein